jgi:acylphosphatase
MNLLNLLTISFLLTLFPEWLTVAENPCREINATATVKNTTNRKDGSVTVTIEGNSSQFRIFLMAPKKEDNRPDLPVEEIKNLSPGDYVVVITEAKEGEFCPKHIKVAIK